MDVRVEAEVTKLVANINLMTGITNIFDYNRCLDMFERLRSEGILFDPEEIRRMLCDQCGMLPEDAKDVQKMAAKFLAGKRVKRRQ